jgi:hypothetical protein
MQDSANVLYSESQGTYIPTLQGFLHSQLPQELFWGACKGVPWEVGFECPKKGLTWTFSMCFVKENDEIDLTFE